MNHDDPISLRRRQLIGGLGALGVTGVPVALAAAAPDFIDLPFQNGRRPLSSEMPQKSAMVLQRARPPLLETPFSVFDQGVFTPNNEFYVRWHLAGLPPAIDPETYQLDIHGQVRTPVSLTLKDLVNKLPQFEITAVNQCSGNSRGFFAPRVPGGQWGNGAMGNAVWTGVRLKDVLDLAGVRPNAVAVRFSGLDAGVLPETPKFLKSLDIEHARDGEVMLAYAMNGETLPFLNGYPLRLVVPGWYATYWVKMVHDIEVLGVADDNYWMTKAYMIPDTPFANMHPGQTGVHQVPINRMVPRSFITNLQSGAVLHAGQPSLVRGIAFGGSNALKRVQLSFDGGQTWIDTELGEDHGRYSFRQWHTTVSPLQKTKHVLMVRATDTAGQAQPDAPNWNGGGYMRNVIESIQVDVV